MSVRAKFRVHSVEKMGGGTQVYLSPVYAETEENKKFFAYTPSGQVSMYIKNEVAEEQFKTGYEFYIDFTKAE